MSTTSLRIWAALASLGLLLAPTGPARAAAPVATASATAASAPPKTPDAEVLDAMPMAFEPNVGQTDARVRYVARGRGYTVFLTDEGLTLSLAGSDHGDAARDRRARLGEPEAAPSAQAVRMSMVGARYGSTVAEEELPGKSSYLVGRDEQQWHRDVPNYRAVRRAGVYDGVDAVYYGTRQRLEYDFVVAPGADPSQICVRFEGQRAATVDEHGDLVLELAGGALRHRRASVYQNDGAGKRSAVPVRYVLHGDGEIGFEIGEYDRSQPLVVDPVLEFAVYLGGSTSFDGANAVAVDSTGAAYVAGTTSSSDFPTTPGAFDTTGPSGGFVMKIAPNGGSIVYSTYLGGQSRAGAGTIAVDSTGAVVVTGSTDDGFPTTPGAYDTTFNGFVDGYVAKLSANGSSLLYSTYLGGGGVEEIADVVLDASGAAFITGTAFRPGIPIPGFPTTAGAYDTTQSPEGRDGFVAKLSADGSSLAYSTFVGAAAEARGVALGPEGTVIVGGTAFDLNFPTTPGAYDTTYDNDCFVLKLNATGSAAVYSTFFGGSGVEAIWAVASDASGAAYIAGDTTSPDLPFTSLVFDPIYGGEYEGFAAKLSPDGTTAVYATYLGGSREDSAFAITVDSAGAAYVAGQTASSDFPATTGAFDISVDGNSDAYLVKIAPDGRAGYSTLLGGTGSDFANGVAIDAAGAAYVVGIAGSGDYPLLGGLPSGERDTRDAFVTKVSASGASLVYSAVFGAVDAVGPSFENADSATSVAVDASGAIYLTGSTQSLNFPATPGAFDTTYLDLTDAFLAKLSPDGSAIVYSTFLGGKTDDVGMSVAVDTAGAAYVGGYTLSIDFPTTPGAFAPNAPNPLAGESGFVVKVAPDGGSLAYGTYLGGSGDDVVWGLAVDGTGAAYAVGSANSNDFPTTPGAFDTAPTFGDGFVTKLAPDGASLAYSTYLGGFGSEVCRAVAVDAAGTAYVTGETLSADFPVTSGAFDTTFSGSPIADAFVTRVSASGASLIYSTYLGGMSIDTGNAIVIDASGNACVGGVTHSLNFPTTPGALSTSANGPTDGFVTKLNAAGSALVFSTYLGGDSTDTVQGLAVSPTGLVIATGTTVSETFPTTPDALDLSVNADDGFLTAFEPTGAVRYSTYLGGNGFEVANAVAVDLTGAVAIVGSTTSTDLAATGFGNRDNANAFVAKLRLPAAGSQSGDTPGVYVTTSGAWFLRNSSTPGGADITFTFGGGGAGLVPLTGDWDGDGDDTPGLYATSTGAVFLKNTNAGGVADIVFTFGAGGLVPLSGDWNGDGVDTIGLYDPATGAFFLRNTNTPGAADAVFTFGGGGAGIAPVTGDWNGDGADTVGLYVRSTGTFFLRNSNTPGAADLAFSYGPSNATPILGDWNGDGIETVGIYVPGTAAWFLRDTNAPGGANTVFSYGPTGVTPLAGDWDGQ